MCNIKAMASSTRGRELQVNTDKLKMWY